MAKVTSSLEHHAKKLTAFILVFIMFITSFSLVSSDVKAAAGFYVSGTTICDANGNAFVMRGVNVPHAWFTSQTETSLKAIASLGANTVRVVCSNGMQYNKTSYSELTNIINLCKQNKLICVLEVHDATGSDSTSDLNAAVNYWIEMKNVLKGNEAYVILNIANEWYGSWDGAKWASGNINAIKSIRNAGISNMIMIDSAGWGQYPDSIKNYGKSVFNADSQKNTVFSIHMYEYAGGNASTVRTNIDNALSIGVPVVIGEFGGYHTGGDVDELTILSYCQQKGVGYLAWSWKGNGSNLEYLDLANNWDGSSLTDFGNTVFYNTNGIKNTSRICSVYGSSSGSNSGSNSGSSNSGSSSSGSTSSGPLDGVYFIKSVFSGKYLDIASNSSANGANLQQYQYTGGNNQKFKLVSDGNGYYSIMTGASNYSSCIDVSGKSTANGTNIAQWSYNSGDNQKFQVVNVGGKYAIKTKITNNASCLDVYDWSTANGGNIAQYNYWGGDCQLWYLEKADGSSSSSSSNNSSNNSSSNNTSSGDAYTSLFWGENSASNWGQAVSVATTRAGGSFKGSDITSNGYFYVEYSGSKDQVELILQSWSGGSDWGKVSISESGTANGNYYAKFSYNNLKSAFGSTDFAGKLDMIHVGAKSGSVKVYSVCYCYN